MFDLVIHEELYDFNATTVRVRCETHAGRALVGHGEAVRFSTHRKTGVAKLIDFAEAEGLTWTTSTEGFLE